MKTLSTILRTAGAYIIIILLFGSFTSLSLIQQSETPNVYEGSQEFLHSTTLDNLYSQPYSSIEYDLHDYLNFDLIEPAPEIESWMFDIDYYDETEEAPGLEEWMFDEYYYEEIEEVPEIEDWMFDEYYYEETEELPEIEDWMFDDSFLP